MPPERQPIFPPRPASFGRDCKSLQIPLPLLRGFCSHPRVKFFVSLLALCALTLTACNTLNTRRALYSPGKASGPYTDRMRYGKPLSQPQYVERRVAREPDGSLSPAEPLPPAL